MHGTQELPPVQVQVPLNVLVKLETDKVNHHRLKLWRPGTVAITENSEGKILLIRSTRSRNWGFPQGGVERDEDLIRGLVRELYEETGIAVSEVRNFCLLDKQDIPNWERDGFTKGKRYYYFHVLCEGVPDVALQLSEVCDFQWLSPRRAEEFISAIGDEYRQKRESMLIALKNAVG
ncbi:MAG: NUDIX hydrolase [Candidatus Paceibacterota bacterium]|jgi:8-oxo-dGTP pyrophosphatase MutT (NUDIX family)